jgi:hypothetical protein
LDYYFWNAVVRLMDRKIKFADLDEFKDEIRREAAAVPVEEIKLNLKPFASPHY